VNAADGTLLHRYLYVAENGGVGVYEVTNDVVTGRLAFWEAHAEVYAVAVLGHYAFVADAWYGLDVLDLSNPTQPALYAEVSDPTPIPLMSDIAVDAAHERIAVAGQVPAFTYVFNLHNFLATGDRSQLAYTTLTTPSGPNGIFGDWLGRAAFVQVAAKDVLLVPEQSGLAMHAVDLATGDTIATYHETNNANQYGAYSVEPFTSAAMPGRQLAVRRPRRRLPLASGGAPPDAEQPPGRRVSGRRGRISGWSAALRSGRRAGRRRMEGRRYRE